MGAINFYETDGNVSDIVTSDIFNVLIDSIDRYSIYLAKNFAKKRVNYDSLVGFKEPFWIGLDKSKFLRSLKVQVGKDLLKQLNQSTLKLENNDTIDILIYANIAEYICNELYDAVFLESDSEGYNYYCFDEDDKRKKRIEFIDEVNQILERNNLAYKLSNQGTFERIITEDFRAILDVDVDNIETEVNKYISDAKMKIKSCDKEKRVEAIEILWKAFERLKSLYVSQGIDKRKSVEMLVEKTMNEQPVLFNLVNNVLMKDFLTKAGNDLRIRHHETDKENLHEDNQIDLLFQIMLVTLNYLINSQERF